MYVLLAGVQMLSRSFTCIDELLQVKQLFVRSSHRRQGLGGLLLDGMKKATQSGDGLGLSVKLVVMRV